MPATKQSAVPLGTSGLGRVAWTRGLGCLPLAERLDDGPPIAISGDLQRSCVTDRVDLLVARRFGSFDLVPVAVPHQVDFGNVCAVTAAVGEGPHSPLAAAVAARLALALGVPGELATVYRSYEEMPWALDRLERLSRDYPHLGHRATKESTAVKLIDSLAPSTLLIVGAPGGSWFQRQIYGPGHRLLVAAPAGAIAVRSAPRRCYHEAVEPAGIAVGPRLTVGDALRVVAHQVVPVADNGHLVGMLRATAMTEVPSETRVAHVMEPAVAVTSTARVSAAGELAEFLEHSPVPVVDPDGRLIGVIPSGTDQVAAGPEAV